MDSTVLTIETGAGSEPDAVAMLERQRVVLVDTKRDNPRRTVRLSFLPG